MLVCQLARYTTSLILSNEITRRLALVSLARALVEQTRGPHVPILTFPDILRMSALVPTSVSWLRIFSEPICVSLPSKTNNQGDFTREAIIPFTAILCFDSVNFCAWLTPTNVPEQICRLID